MNLGTFKNFFSSIFFFFILWSILASSLHAQTWQHLGLYGEEISVIAIDSSNPNIVFVGSNSDYSEGRTGKLFKSTNGGLVWDTLIYNITVRDIDIHPADHNIVFITGGSSGLTPEGIFKTTDGGISWNRSDSGITVNEEVAPKTLEIDFLHPETLYVGTLGFYGGNLYKSINGGNSWSRITSSSYLKNGVTALGISHKHTNIIYAGINAFSYLLRSTDGGESWTNLWTQLTGINTINFDKSDNVYVGGGLMQGQLYTLFFSTDSFKTWNGIDFGSRASVRKIVMTKDTIYICGSDSLFRVIQNLKMEKLDIQGNTCREIAIAGNYLYIGTKDGILRKEIVTNVKHTKDFIPLENELFQNFPNPFNSSTTITFNLAHEGFVKVELYDGLGRQIAVILNQYVDSGFHSVLFNSEMPSYQLSSGTYFYTLLQNGKILYTRGLMLIK